MLGDHLARMILSFSVSEVIWDFVHVDNPVPLSPGPLVRTRASRSTFAVVRNTPTCQATLFSVFFFKLSHLILYVKNIRN